MRVRTLEAHWRRGLAQMPKLDGTYEVEELAARVRSNVRRRTRRRAAKGLVRRGAGLLRVAFETGPAWCRDLPWLRLFELHFTNLSLSSRRTISGPDDVALSYSATLGSSRAGPCLRHRRTTVDSSCGAGLASSEYHGGLAPRCRRWIGPTSDYEVTYNGSDPLIHTAAHVS